MSDFYKPYKRKKLLRALKKIGLDIKEKSKHTKAECIHNGKKTTVPRHTVIKSEVTNKIYEFLLDKFQKEEIEKIL